MLIWGWKNKPSDVNGHIYAPRLARWGCEKQSAWGTGDWLNEVLESELLIGRLGGWRRHLEDRAGGWILGHEDLVLDAVHKEAVSLSAVGVVSLCQRHQLHRLALRGTEGVRHKHGANQTLTRQGNYDVILWKFRIFRWWFSHFDIKCNVIYHASFVFTTSYILSHNISRQFHSFTWQFFKLNFSNFSRKLPVFYGILFMLKLSHYFVKLFCFWCETITTFIL